MDPRIKKWYDLGEYVFKGPGRPRAATDVLNAWLDIEDHAKFPVPVVYELEELAEKSGRPRPRSWGLWRAS